MRGLTLVIVLGATKPNACVTGRNVDGSSTCALISDASRCWRRLKSIKKEAFLVSGPPKLAIRFLVSDAGIGLLKLASVEARKNGFTPFSFQSRYTMLTEP